MNDSNNKTNYTENNQSYNYNLNDEELLKAFVGNNYYKITTRQFNFAGFFFTTFYMFYRKMFLYGILLFILDVILVNVIKNVYVSSVIAVLTGLLVNKIYLDYAQRKITKIKLENPQKNIEELKTICSMKGGTSVGKIILGFFTELVTVFIMAFIMVIIGIGSLFIPSNWNNSNTNIFSSSTTETLVEDVIIGDYSCFGSKCDISLEESNGTKADYVLNYDGEFFNILDDYTDYVKINVYYKLKRGKRVITSYKIYLRSNNEDISNIKTEDELKTKLGL